MPVSGGGGYQALTGAALDSATTAWVAAVVGDGGTVSDTEKSYVDALIVGLKADGVFTKYDRLWLFASENQFQAKRDIVATALATAVSNPAFTANRGYTGDGVTNYIDSNFNPTSASGHWTQTSCCAFAWCNTSGGTGGALIGTSPEFSPMTRMYPNFGGGAFYWSVNDIGGNILGGQAVNQGLYLGNCVGTADTMDFNGSQIDSHSTVGVDGLQNSNVWFLNGANGFGPWQICCGGFGGGLTSQNRSDTYTRLRTYMTAVGV